MKRNPAAALLLFIVSGLVALSFSLIKKISKKNTDKKGEIFITAGGDATCRTGTVGNCVVSDCEIPNISTGCDDPNEDDQTTVNDN